MPKLTLIHTVGSLPPVFATVARDAPVVKGTLKSLEFRGADSAKVETLFTRLGFNRIRDRVAYQG